MNFSKYTTNFPFKSGDVIYSKHGNDNSILKIKKIDKRNDYVVVDEIIIRDDGTFEAYVDEWYSINTTEWNEWYSINTTEWNEYVKIEDSEIFENLLNIINKYNDKVQQLNDDAYLKLKNEIAPYDN